MARASSLVNVMRQVFGAVGSALFITYFTQQATAHGNDIAAALRTAQQAHKPPAGVAGQCFAQFGQHMDKLQACGAAHAFTQGFNDTFTLVTIATAVCVVLALFAGRDRNLVAAKRAAASGQAPAPQPRPAMVGE